MNALGFITRNSRSPMRLRVDSVNGVATKTKSDCASKSSNCTGVNQNVFLSGRNLPKAHVMPFGDASTYDLLWSDVVLVEASAIGHTLAPLTEKAMEKVKVKKASAPKTPKARKASETSKKAVAKKAAVKKAPAKKPAAKKTAAKPAAPKKAPAKKAAAPKKKGK